jgi:hypothetical protein
LPILWHAASRSTLDDLARPTSFRPAPQASVAAGQSVVGAIMQTLRRRARAQIRDDPAGQYLAEFYAPTGRNYRFPKLPWVKTLCSYSATHAPALAFRASADYRTDRSGRRKRSLRRANKRQSSPIHAAAKSRPGARAPGSSRPSVIPGRGAVSILMAFVVDFFAEKQHVLLYQLRNSGLRPGCNTGQPATGAVSRSAYHGGINSALKKRESSWGVFGRSFAFKDVVSSAMSISFCLR